MKRLPIQWLIRCAFIAAITLFLDAAFPSLARAQQSQLCAKGVTLRLNAAVAAQGALLELTLNSTAPIADLTGTWAGNPLPFWAAGSDRVHHALLGIDLERAPGKYDLAVSGQVPGSDPFECKATVTVKEGHFTIENLKVADQFVNPNPEESARGEKDSARIHEIYANPTIARLWTGKFRAPLDGITTGHNFGKRRVLNGEKRSPHTGLDMPAKTGTPIHASQRGRVMLADDLYFSGNTVILDHGLGVYTFYCHMSAIKVAAGDMVDAGTVIGLVGATGRVTGPHLHWSLNVNGARVNPLQIVSLGVH
jgi:murein DD-endopeptidase MepM/ murein hydrolase activator NlpD